MSGKEAQPRALSGKGPWRSQPQFPRGVRRLGGSWLSAPRSPRPGRPRARCPRAGAAREPGNRKLRWGSRTGNVGTPAGGRRQQGDPLLGGAVPRGRGRERAGKGLREEPWIAGWAGPSGASQSPASPVGGAVALPGRRVPRRCPAGGGLEGADSPARGSGASGGSERWLVRPPDFRAGGLGFAAQRPWEFLLFSLKNLYSWGSTGIPFFSVVCSTSALLFIRLFLFFLASLAFLYLPTPLLFLRLALLYRLQPG